MLSEAYDPALHPNALVGPIFTMDVVKPPGFIAHEHAKSFQMICWDRQVFVQIITSANASAVGQGTDVLKGAGHPANISTESGVFMMLPILCDEAIQALVALNNDLISKHRAGRILLQSETGAGSSQRAACNTAQKLAFRLRNRLLATVDRAGGAERAAERSRVASAICSAPMPVKGGNVVFSSRVLEAYAFAKGPVQARVRSEESIAERELVAASLPKMGDKIVVMCLHCFS